MLTLALFFTAGCSKTDQTSRQPTALDLAKLGNKYIGEHARDKVVQIRAEKSVGGLYPTVWYVVYFDQTAPLKAVQVKFGAGQMMDVDRPLRLLEPIFGQDQPLPANKIKVDSDDAIRIAIKEPILKNVKTTATAPKLERDADSSPVWKVRIWASKARSPNEEVELGEVSISATDGKVRTSKLEISRVN